MLRRVLAWAGRFAPGLSARLDAISDPRVRPRIATARVTQSLFLMTLARVGSRNALEQTRDQPVWRRRLGGALPSADALGRVAAGLPAAELRPLLTHFYTCSKRAKALPPPFHGLMALVLDGHEVTATDRRTCPGGCTRQVQTATGAHPQHYHRYVAASLVAGDVHSFLDAEEIQAGEDEIAAALRLLARVHAALPRAFDVVCADAFYAQARFVQAVCALGKDACVVLKQEARDLYQDVQGLLPVTAPTTFSRRGGRTQVEAWDFPALTSWPTLGRPVRVVRTVETTTVRRQQTGADEPGRAEWMWVTTLAPARASTRAVVEVGHRRWDIENQGFNAAVTQWHLDHVYRHEPGAMRALLLLTMLAMNVLTLFYRRDLKPAVRARASMQHIARLVTVALYGAPDVPATG